MSLWLVPLWLVAADPEVSRAVANIDASQGEARALAVRSYVQGCRGPNRFAFRNNAGALETLRPLFEDPDAAVRRAALDLAVCYPTPALVDPIVVLLKDPDPAVRERAYEEAAHAATPAVLSAVSAIVQDCASRSASLSKEEQNWCVFAMYALGECGKATTDGDARLKVADLSAALATTPHVRIRQHVLRNLELCGSARHVAAVNRLARLTGLPADQRSQARKLARQLKRRK